MDRALANQSEELLKRQTLSVTDQISMFFSPPQRILVTQQTTLERTSFDLRDDASIEARFYDVLSTSPELSSFFLVRNDGSFVHLDRLDEGGGFVTRTGDMSGRTVTRLERGTNFEPQRRALEPFEGMDPRLQSWFNATLVGQPPVWSDRNQFYADPTPQMTLAIPIMREGRHVGVLGSDIDLGSLGEILLAEARNQVHTTTVFNSNGQVVLYVTDGKIVLDTSLQTLTEDVDPIPELAFATRLASVMPASPGFRFSSRTNGTTELFLGQLQPVDSELGLPWTIALHARRSDMSGGLQENFYWLIAISIGTLLLLSLVSVPIANRIRRPLVLFSNKSRQASKFSAEEGTALSAPYSELKVTGEALNEEISQRRAYESALEQSLTVTSRGEARFNPHSLKILQANDRLCAMLGISKSKLQKLHLPDTLSTQSTDALASLSETVLRDREFSAEADFQASGSGTQKLRLTAFLIRDEAGTPDYALAIFEDPSQISNPIERLDYIKRELYHISRVNLLGEFAAGLAHELNQPLGALVHDLDSAMFVLDDADLNREELRDIFRDIDRHAHRAGDIIRALRDLIQKDTAVPKAFELDELLKQTLSIMEPEARMYNASVEIQQASKFKVFGIRGQLAQVLVNLIRNALEAMDASGQSDGLVRISTYKTETGIAVSVQDNGPGFPPGIRPFAQFQTTSRTGLGLGLSICKSLVEANGGKISYEGLKPHGTRFLIELKGDVIEQS